MEKYKRRKMKAALAAKANGDRPVTKDSDKSSSSGKDSKKRKLDDYESAAAATTKDVVAKSGDKKDKKKPKLELSRADRDAAGTKDSKDKKRKQDSKEGETRQHEWKIPRLEAKDDGPKSGKGESRIEKTSNGGGRVDAERILKKKKKKRKNKLHGIEASDKDKENGGTSARKVSTDGDEPAPTTEVAKSWEAKTSDKKKNKKKSHMRQNSNPIAANNKPASITRTDPTKTTNAVAPGESKRRQKMKEKRKRTTLKVRKETRAELGQYSAIKKLSMEEMRRRIEELESRGSLSNTATRKLRVLKVKLRAAEAEAAAAASEQSNEKPRVDETRNDEEKSEVEKKKKKKKKEKKEKEEAEKPFSVCEIEEGELVEKPEDAMFVEDRVGERATAAASPAKLSKKQLKKQLKRLKWEQKRKDSAAKVEVVSHLKADEDQKSPSKISAKSVLEDKDDKEGSEDGEIVEAAEEKKSEIHSGDSGKKEGSGVESKAKEGKLGMKQKKRQVEGAKKMNRYILFVKNMNPDTTTVDLKKHFLTKVNMVRNIRMPQKSGANNSSRFAYIEFEDAADFEKGLSLHGTILNGRPIKIEYTKANSNKGYVKQEITHKNKKLHAMMKQGLLAGSKKEKHKRSYRRNLAKKLKGEKKFQRVNDH